MEFFIQQGGSLPILKMDVVKDGRTDASNNFYSILYNSSIKFSMKNIDNGIQKIFMNPAYVVQKFNIQPNAPKEYYIYYKWSANDTKQKGRYVGEFCVLLPNGELISPIRENLYINII
jgi:hypothetical protein